MNKNQCIGCIERDVEKIMKYATGIIVISPDGTLKFIENKNSRLGILAVIGPADPSDQKLRPKEISKLNFNKALLMEVGLGAGKPYHKAKGINKKKHQPFISKRRKWFSLTEKQYKLVMPFIFNFIIEKSLDKIRGWKLKGFSYSSVTILKHKNSKIISRKTYKDYLRGTRFAVSPKDDFFIKDLISIAKNNSQTLKQIRGLYYFVEMELRYFLKKRKPNSFKKSETAWLIKEEIKKMSVPLRGYILHKISEEKKRPVYNDLVDVFGTKEINHLPVKKEVPLFFSFDGVDIKIAIPPKRKYKIKRKRSKRDSLTFEIFPHNLLTLEDLEEYENEKKRRRNERRKRIYGEKDHLLSEFFPHNLLASEDLEEYEDKVPF